jgi:hypothetical protein
MPTIRFSETTSATLEELVAAVTDLGPGRSEIFGNSTDEYLKVYDRGPTTADVTEGSRGNSGHPSTFARNPDGTTGIDVVIVRALPKAFANTVKAVEARNVASRQPLKDCDQHVVLTDPPPTTAQARILGDARVRV